MDLSAGTRTIILTVLIAGAGALLFPVSDDNGGNDCNEPWYLYLSFGNEYGDYCYPYCAADINPSADKKPLFEAVFY